MARVEVVGMTALMKKLKDDVSMDDVKRVVKHNGSELQQKAQKHADFKKGYQTGTTKRSISLEMKSNGLTAEVQPGTEYAAYLEFGTRFMDAQKFVGPAYKEQKQKFKSDMDKLTR
ncbi:MAG: HK97 gp10 family phage protein [Bacteroidaceae bacterium]|nr:HK97 gp10 family phage protein [Bacteroidaceae bacterium]